VLVASALFDSKHIGIRKTATATAILVATRLKTWKVAIALL